MTISEDESKKEIDTQKEIDKIMKEQEEQEQREEISQLKVFKFQNPGDKLSGILLELTTVPTQYSPTAPFAKIKTENDGICGIFLSYELQQILKPELIGDKVEIGFKGKINTGRGNKMNKFEVFRIRKNKELQGVSNDVNNVGTIIYPTMEELLEMEKLEELAGKLNKKE